MSPPALVEPIIGIIRAGPVCHNFGDPYSFSATLVLDGQDAYVKGASGQFTWQLFFDIKFQLINYGIKRVHWERLKDGKSKNVTIKI